MYIQTCHVCQLVKYNNEKKEGTMIPITSTHILEKVFLDICGPFPRSGGWHRHKFIIIWDHFSNYTKLYPINRATTTKVLDIIINNYIPKLRTPRTIITDNGTQFKGQIWKETLLRYGIKTYKTSVYHPTAIQQRECCERSEGSWGHTVSMSKGNGAVSYTHLDVYKRQQDRRR